MSKFFADRIIVSARITFMLLASCFYGYAQRSSVVTSDTIIVRHLPLDTFIQRSEGPHADIFGGCVAITEGGVASSVIMMALEVTKKREPNMVAAKRELINRMIDSLKSMQDSLLTMADQDRAMFNVYRTAYHLPANTPEEKKVADAVIAAANLQATITPINAVRIMVSILRMVKRAILLVNAATRSDAFAGAHLIKGSLDATLSIANDDISRLPEMEKIKFSTTGKQYAQMAATVMEQITILEHPRKK